MSGQRNSRAVDADGLVLVPGRPRTAQPPALARPSPTWLREFVRLRPTARPREVIDAAASVGYAITVDDVRGVRGDHPPAAPPPDPLAVAASERHPDGSVNLSAYVRARPDYKPAELAAALRKHAGHNEVSSRTISQVRYLTNRVGPPLGKRPAVRATTTTPRPARAPQTQRHRYTVDEMTELVRRIATQHGYDRVLAVLKQWAQDTTGGDLA